MQYHPILTTFFAYFLGIATGVLAVVIAKINWSALISGVAKKLYELGQAEVVVTFKKKQKPVPFTYESIRIAKE